MRSPGTVTRREFAALSAGAVLAAAGCRAAPYRRGDFARADESPVVALAAADYGVDFADLITRGLRELRVDLLGRRVLLKPNLVEYEPGTVINTHPSVVIGAAVACRRLGAREVMVAEGPGHRRDLEYLLGSTGLLEELESERVPFVDLNHDDVEAVPLRSWFTTLGELALPQSLLRADIIVSMPKLKTHHWAGVTCSMKNLFGVVPGAVYGWPKNVLHFQGIHESILDIVATVRPQLAIVDGVVGMEGDGPILGTPKHAGVLLLGRDPVAVDATAARVMGLRPERIHYLAEAGHFLGHLDAGKIPMRGERIERFVTPFAVLPAFAALRA
ncbi:MAG: DUF362 domain-containing protein [Acidobacteria bacterium]|nr:DUF362 domain-containing protein [Acidobacteriota bacterium]